MDGGDGRTPERGLVCPDSPPVSELKRFRLHVCRDGGRQSCRASESVMWRGEASAGLLSMKLGWDEVHNRGQ